MLDALLAEAEQSGERRLVAQVDGAPAELLRAVATRLTALPDAVALLAGGTAEGTPVLAARGAYSDFDCGAFIKQAASARGGRGGGRAERSDGRLPASIDWKALVAELLVKPAGPARYLAARVAHLSGMIILICILEA